MEYKLMSTTQGPAIVSEDEVVFFNQFPQMLDYYEEDPEFLVKAKKLVAEGLTSTATDMAKGMFEPVVGGDLSPYLYGYVNALRSLADFEFRYLPGIPKG